MAAGSLVLLLAIFMISLCRSYWQFFLAQGVLAGAAMSFIAIPASGMVPRYFKRNKGLATGITVAGSSLGGVIWPIAFDQLLHHDRVGFPWAMRAGGFIMIPLLVVAVVTVKPPIVARRDAETGGSVDATGSQEKPQEGKEEKKKKDLTALKSPAFFLLCAVSPPLLSSLHPSTRPITHHRRSRASS
jgi:MFS family permease